MIPRITLYVNSNVSLPLISEGFDMSVCVSLCRCLQEEQQLRPASLPAIPNPFPELCSPAGSPVLSPIQTSENHVSTPTPTHLHSYKLYTKVKKITAWRRKVLLKGFWMMGCLSVLVLGGKNVSNFLSYLNCWIITWTSILLSFILLSFTYLNVCVCVHACVRAQRLQ